MKLIIVVCASFLLARWESCGQILKPCKSQLCLIFTVFIVHNLQIVTGVDL